MNRRTEESRRYIGHCGCPDSVIALACHGSRGSDADRRALAAKTVPHATYEQEEIRLSAGDLLAVVSDGVSEALNPAGEEYGDERLENAIAPNWLEPSDAVLQTLLASVRGFAQGAPQNDDVTALIVRFTPKGRS